MIFTRKTKNGKVRFTAAVIDDYHGIRDCFGFYEISEFECDKIIERFYKNEKEVEVSPQTLKTILIQAELLSKQKTQNWLIPYEYVCWKNLLADIEGDNRAYKDILASKLEQKQLYETDLNKIFEMDFTDKWFLDANYSDEFEEITASDTDDFEKLVSENTDKVFYPEEKQVWSERLLSAAYLKLSQNKNEDAELLYGLYLDKNLQQKFFKTILKKSIYEYYVSMKFNTELNNGRYSLKQLDEIISKIEGLWVCTK